MRILSLKAGHDGAIAYVEDNNLIFSIEAEKDSNDRFAELSAAMMVQALKMIPNFPDIVALGGWLKPLPDMRWNTSQVGAGYLGLNSVVTSYGTLFGQPVRYFSSSHERSHIYMATAMDPGGPREECAILVWEGSLGVLYHWREFGKHISRFSVLDDPGGRYVALFALAEPTFPDHGEAIKDEYAGKLMALAAYADDEPLSEAERDVVEYILSSATIYPFNKASLRSSALYNCGVTDPKLCRAAKYLTDRIFEIFCEEAINRIPEGVPLLISGGCGLNCDWNRRWMDCGHFSEVFVPPCTNDSGSAIGTAADAMQYFHGPSKLEWNVYSGLEFEHDMVPEQTGWMRYQVNYEEISEVLICGAILAWVQGRCEIGPRSLGHRSLLASPLIAGNRTRLNDIKKRESYRPIAASGLSEDLEKWFESPVDDPYMLYFNKNRTPLLPAVTHVDGSTRLHSVGENEVSAMRGLLRSFRERTGVGLLCNTSLNFQGKGFINRLSELVAYCEANNINEIVVNDVWYRRR